MTLRDQSAFARGVIVGAGIVLGCVLAVVKFLELLIRSAS
jgi:hypothetical protein